MTTAKTTNKAKSKTRPKAAAKKTTAKPTNFTESVFKKLGRKNQSSVEIAVKLGLVDDEGNAKASGATKVRKALQQLEAEGRAAHEGSFKTSVYRLPD